MQFLKRKLGIRSLTDEANERKLKMLTGGVDKGDQTGHALCGMFPRGHRIAGRGGLEDTEMEIGESLGESMWITSLLEWLNRMRLMIKTCGSRKRNDFAADERMGMEEKIELNRRGIVMRDEGDGGVDGGVVAMRVGQCWKVGGDVLEIQAGGAEKM